MSIWTINIAGRLPMLRVRQFINNPQYFVYFLKRHFWYKRISQRFIDRYKEFTFLTGEETINKLLQENLSLSRFSDGEIDMLTGMSVFDPKMSWSQPYSNELRKALEKALNNRNPRLLIAHTSPKKFLLTNREASAKGISHTMWTDTRVHLHKYLQPGKQYGDAHALIPNDNPQIDWQAIKDHLKQYDIIVVTGGVETLKHLSLGKCTFFVEAGKHNAFSRYSDIVSSIKDIFKTKGLDKTTTLIMASLGPTASILAADMCDQGYLIWDSGHIFKYAADKLK